jgi:Ca2+/Na+ antiporter
MRPEKEFWFTVICVATGLMLVAAAIGYPSLVYTYYVIYVGVGAALIWAYTQVCGRIRWWRALLAVAFWPCYVALPVLLYFDPRKQVGFIDYLFSDQFKAEAFGR